MCFNKFLFQLEFDSFFLVLCLGFLVFILYYRNEKNGDVWGQRVVGNDEEVVLGLRSFDA